MNNIEARRDANLNERLLRSIERIKKGIRADLAIELLRYRSEGIVRGHIHQRHKLGPGDEDVVIDDIYRRATSAAKRFDQSKGTVLAWLMGIADKAVADVFRKGRPPISMDPNVDYADERALVEKEAMKKMTSEQMRYSLSLLERTHPRRHLVIMLRIFEEKSYDDIKKEMHLPNLQAARQLFYYGLRDLQGILKGLGISKEALGDFS